MPENATKPMTGRIQEGYQPREQRGYIPVAPSVTPRPPRGGTAVVNSPTANPTVGSAPQDRPAGSLSR